MNIAIVAAHQDVHGTFTPGKQKLITGTTGALLEQARWGVRQGHQMWWIGNCENTTWEGVRFVASVREALRQQREWDIAVMHSESIIPDFPARLRIMDLQVFYPRVDPRRCGVHAVQCHSDYQRDWLCNRGAIDLETSYVVPNGYDPSVFYAASARPENEERVFLWTTSPDRGLWHVFPILDRLAARGLRFRLHVFYDVMQAVTGYWWAMDVIALHVREIWEGMKKPYVVYHGPVPREELAEWYRTADLLLYPCDPVWPTETFCTTMVECLACGCIPLISDADCLPMYQDVAAMLPLPIDHDQWADAILRILSDKAGEDTRLRGVQWAEQFRWERIAPLWQQAYEQFLQ